MRISVILIAALISMSSFVPAQATTESQTGKKRSGSHTGRSRGHKKSSSHRKHTTTPKSGNVA